jgi:hypothetical protein
MTDIKIKGLPKFKITDYNYYAFYSDRKVYLLGLDMKFLKKDDGDKFELPEKHHVELFLIPTDRNKSVAGVIIKPRR